MHIQQNGIINGSTDPGSDEDIVLSGISGRFPESNSMAEFEQNLFSSVDMVTDDESRWPRGLYGLPSRNGKCRNLDKFDAQFFGINGKQADVMDPQVRFALECVYEAIVDAGIDPETLRGTCTGVYFGCSNSETQEALTMNTEDASGYVLTGNTRSMYANRVSFTFDFTGPSYAIDTACSSSALAVVNAMNDMRSGRCERAIVLGAQVNLKPITSLMFHRMSMLSMDGMCRHLDAHGSGYVRSDCVSAMLLQRRSQAKRVYCTVVHSKTNTDGFKGDGITFPSRYLQQQLLEQTYAEASIDPVTVNYVEAHGTGTKAGDPQESYAITEVFCKDRKVPLLIGSVKSNMGHAEPASGMASLAKITIAIQRDEIPPNLHFKDPNPDVDGLIKGQIKPVTEVTPLPKGLIGMNSFGFGGVNVHLVLKPECDGRLPSLDQVIPTDYPRIVQFCGRSDEAVNHVFDFIKSHPQKVTHEFLSLLNDVSKTSPSTGMTHRGFTILNQDITSVEKSKDKRPIWFVYSGMGSQWTSMGKGLMGLPVFAEAIKRCHDVLIPLGCDVLKIVTSDDEQVIKEPTAPFVGIAAVQIGLTNLLTSLGIRPDGIMGHSAGELGCAYADGAFTLEQTILSAYWRGKSIQDAHVPLGQMAAVGLTWEECESRCPDGVYPACHNDIDSVTISGLEKDTKAFVSKLKDEGLFAREVASNGIAFHSPYIKAAAPFLLSNLKRVITDPKKRTSRWVSTSIPEHKWSEPSSGICDAAYCVNNLTSPVLFYSGLKKIPSNALVIEIAPHNLMSNIVKRCVGPDIVSIGLMKRGNIDGAMTHLFNAIGHMYIGGINPQIEHLYQSVTYPVPTGTQSLNSLIKWDHSADWLVPLYPDHFNTSSGGDHSIKVDVSDPLNSYIVDHIIDGRVLYPATGYLHLAWKLLAHVHHTEWTSVPIHLENLTLHRATIINPKTPIIQFNMNYMASTGAFTIDEGGSLVVSGVMHVLEDTNMEDLTFESTDQDIELTTKDIYKELRVRGYDYGPHFQSIESVIDGRHGVITYRDNFVTFADAMLQQRIFFDVSRTLKVPTKFESIKIDPTILLTSGDHRLVTIDHDLNITKTNGMQIKGFKMSSVPRRVDEVATIESYKFVPFESTVHTLDQDITNHIRLCDMIVSKKSDEEVDKVISSPQPNQVLPLILNELNVTGEKGTNRVLEKYRHQLGHDVLNNTFARENMLRPVIDLMSDNLPSTVDMIELNETSSLVTNEVIKGFKRNQLKTRCTVGHQDPDVFLDQKDDHITFTQWNWTSSSQSPASAHVLLFKDGSFNLNPSSLTPIDHVLTSLIPIVKQNGFLVMILRTGFSSSERSLYPHNVYEQRFDQLKRLAMESEMITIGSVTDGFSSILLLRVDGHHHPMGQHIVYASRFNYDWVDQLRLRMKQIESADDGDHVWLVSQDGYSDGIHGLITCLRREPGGDRVRMILDLDSAKIKVDFTRSPYDHILRSDLVFNVKKKAVWGSLRHMTMGSMGDQSQVMTRDAFLDVMTKGDLSSFKWVEAPHKYWKPSPDGHEQLIHIYYSPLNFRDVMFATGKLSVDALPGNFSSNDCVLGLEFSGRDITGRKVMGMVSTMGLATTLVMDDPEFLWPVPSNWSLEDAATVPVVYSTAYYALVVRGRLQSGESVLIHSGSGGVGQAAISIALSMGCTVFTTVGSNEKRNFLKKQFPQLSDHNFANSRDVTFERHILKATHGKGVDIVLNSLSEEKLQASIRCLAQHGRFCEIGKFDLSMDNPLGMSCFLKNITFHGILLDALFTDGQGNDLPPALQQDKRMITQLVMKGIKSGAVRPLHRHIYSKDQVEQAFRFMASGKHTGKVVLQLKEEEKDEMITPQATMIPAIARSTFHPEKVYVIIGGLGGFGLELAQWMVHRGAKRLCLTSRSGVTGNYQRYYIRRFRSQGCKVIIATSDASTMCGAEELVSTCESHGVIGGVFNLAMVLKDALLDNQSPETFKESAAPKVDATINLDQVTRSRCPHLEYFVVFSSVSCGRGTAGQTNYGYSNSTMERICERRREQGHHGLAIQWGAIGDVGVVIETMGNEVIIGNSKPQRIPSCMSALDRMIQSPHAVTSSCVFVDINKDSSSSDKKQGILQSLSNIMGVKELGSLDPSIKLMDLGLDSLMGIEIKQMLDRDYDRNVPNNEIRNLTLRGLLDIERGTSTSNGDDGTDKKVGTNRRLSFPTIIPIFQLPSENTIRLNSLDQGKPVFFLPPIEGNFEIMKPIAASLKRPVYGVNWTRQMVMVNDLPKTVDEVIKIMLSIEPTGDHDIVAYSYGTLPAFEVSLKTKVNQLIFLDGSPIFFNHVLDSIKSLNVRMIDLNNVDLNVIAINWFLSFFPKVNIVTMFKDLKSLTSFEEQLKLAVTCLRSNDLIGSISEPEVILSIKSFVQKLHLGTNYVTKQKTSTPITLFKAESGFATINDPNNDLFLSSVSMSPPEVISLQGDHSSFLSINQVDLINQINSRL